MNDKQKIKKMFETIKKILHNIGLYHETINMFEKAFEIPKENLLIIKIKYGKEKYKLHVDTRKYTDNHCFTLSLFEQIIDGYKEHIYCLKERMKFKEDYDR